MKRPTTLIPALALIVACSNTTSGTSVDDRDGASAGSGGAGGGSTGGASSGGTTGSGGTGGASTGGSAGTGGVGVDASTADAAVSCVTADDCPPATSPCRVAVCNGTCAFEPVAAGPASTQVAGDCRRLDCEPDGAINSVVDNADSDDTNPCTADSCTNGIATHTALENSPCNNGAGICDAAGRCIECTVDSDCGTSTECTNIACEQNVCILRHATAGTFCSGFLDQCDGAGNCVDCVDNGGCEECCVCSMNGCVQI